MRLVLSYLPSVQEKPDVLMFVQSLEFLPIGPKVQDFLSIKQTPSVGLVDPGDCQPGPP